MESFVHRCLSMVTVSCEWACLCAVCREALFCVSLAKPRPSKDRRQSGPVCCVSLGRRCSVRVWLSSRRTWSKPTRWSVKPTSSWRRCVGQSSSRSHCRFPHPTSAPTDGYHLYCIHYTGTNTIQYNTKFVKRHVAVASEALVNRSVKKQRRRRTNVL